MTGLIILVDNIAVDVDSEGANDFVDVVDVVVHFKFDKLNYFFFIIKKLTKNYDITVLNLGYCSKML